MRKALVATLMFLIGLFVLSFFIDPPAPEPQQSAQAASKTEKEEKVAAILAQPVAQESWSETALDQHAALRRLYLEFLAFKDGAEFKRFGFGAGGPYRVWSDAVRRINGDMDYARLLYDRCDVIPADLDRHARDHIHGKLSAQVKGDATAWASCFAK